MQYRKFGKLDVNLSLLGFGAMRMPLLDPKDSASVNVDEAVKMIRHSIDSGINYVDTAFNYHGEKSEEVVSKALADGYREKTFLATKNPTWLIEKPGDFTKNLDIQLKRLNTDHIDFYLQHALNKERFDIFKKNDVFKEAMQAKADGKITYFGFSFHDCYEVFEEIINSYDWDFCQIQYNFLDENVQAGVKGLKLAAGKNMGVIIMEPLRGGKMGNKMPPDIKEEFDKGGLKYSTVETAFRFIANHAEAGIMLSGMSDMEQIDENIKICSMEDMVPGKALADRDIDFLRKLADKWNNRTMVSCTACNYCMPCPHGVNIPQCFSTYNLFGSNEGFAEFRARDQYKEIIEKGESAEKCVSCGQCVSACPQAIPIPEKLEAMDKAIKAIM